MSSDDETDIFTSQISHGEFNDLMNQSNSTRNSDIIFECSLKDARKIIPMLRSIYIKSTASMIITKNGLRITVQDDSKCLQAASFLETSLFDRYWMKDINKPSCLCFKLPDFLKILTMFISPDAKLIDRKSFGDPKAGRVRITYKGENEPLLLDLQDGQVTTSAQIATYQLEEMVLFNFDNNNPIITKIISLPDVMVEFWRCVDMQSEFIEINIKPESIAFRTHSELAKFEYKISHNSQYVERYKCDSETVARYKLSLMKMIVKALTESSKLSIRTDTQGLLCFQFMINIDEDNPNCFVEFYIVPNCQE